MHSPGKSITLRAIMTGFIPRTGSILYYAMDMYNNDQVAGNMDRHYYYVDNPQQKIRYIILSRFAEGDSQTIVKNGYEAEQLAWLTNVALNVDAGCSIIVFTHFLSTDTIPDPYGVANALDSYSGNGEIIAVIEGHTHWDYHGYTAGGIPVIATTCDKNTPWVDPSGQDTEPIYLGDRTSGTIKEQAFDVYIINKVAKTLTQVRIGCPIRDGKDPEVWTEYEEVTTSYDRS